MLKYRSSARFVWLDSWSGESEDDVEPLRNLTILCYSATLCTDDTQKASTAAEIFSPFFIMKQPVGNKKKFYVKLSVIS